MLIDIAAGRLMRKRLRVTAFKDVSTGASIATASAILMSTGADSDDDSADVVFTKSWMVSLFLTPFVCLLTL